MDKTFDRAASAARRSKYRDAHRLFKRALAKAKEPEDKLSCLLALADTARMTGSFEESASTYEKAIKLAEKTAPELVYDAMVGQALAMRALGDHAGAIKLIKKSKTFYERNNDAEGSAFSTWALAGALRIKGDIHEAYDTFKEARSKFAKLKDTPGVGYSLCGMGGTSRVMGRFDRSLEHYSDANAIFLKLKDTFGAAYSHCGMGNALRMKGEHTAAREHFIRATTLYKRIGDIVSFAYTLWSLGNTHMMTGHSVLAHEYFKEARGLFKKTNDPRGIIYCKLALAQLSALSARTVYAKKLASDTLNDAKRGGFAVERAHAEVLVSALADKAGKPDNSAYRPLKLSLAFKSLPLNLP